MPHRQEQLQKIFIIRFRWEWQGEGCDWAELKKEREYIMSSKVWVVIALITISLLAGIALVLAQEPLPQVDSNTQSALGTIFTYQGQLKSGGNPVNGKCDFQFSLWDAVTDGTQIGTTQTKSNVSVSNGLFTIPDLDFGGAAFQGDARWLAVAVRCPAGSGTYTALSPRQALTPAPYALALPGLWTQQNAVSPNVIGGYRGNNVTDGRVGATIGGGGASGYVNRVTDNYGTVGGGGGNTASGNATVGGGYQNTASGGDATIGGGWLNTASGGFAAIGGGYANTASNYYATISGGSSNTASGDHATVGGGRGNTAVYTGTTVSGGWSNAASHDYAAVGGGAHNTASGPASTVSGGWSNSASGESASVGGGDYNIAGAAYATIAGGGPSDPDDPTNTNNHVTDDYGAIGGGGYNRAGNGDSDTTNARYATVGGGGGNTASGEDATVGGGGDNTASDAYATVGGGVNNTASSQAATVGGGVNNTASSQAATVGGGYLNTASRDYATVGGGGNNTASGNAATVPGGASNVAGGASSFAAGAQAQATHDGAFVWSSAEATSSWGDNTFTVRAHGGARFYSASGTGTGVQLPSGSGSWSSLSDRAAKENFAPVDGRDLLARLAAIPIQTWNYRSQDPAIRHIGPVAQDFYAAFGVGEDDTHISTVDADGVALAAIQGLYERSQEQEARIVQLEQENAALRSRLDSLEARLAALERQAGGASDPASALPISGLALGGLALLGAAVYRQRAEGGKG